MSTTDLLQKIGGTLASTATVKAVLDEGSIPACRDVTDFVVAIRQFLQMGIAINYFIDAR